MHTYVAGFILLAAAILSGCDDAPRIDTPAATSPWVTEDPTGAFPEGFTVNGQKGAHRAFILERRSFLLGEPIVAELRVWPRDKKETSVGIGGAYRFVGRNGNFGFLLRHEDGTWVPASQLGADRGGLMGRAEATQHTPIQIYNAVQRWCAIERPGRYTLYCFYREPMAGIDEGPGEHPWVSRDDDLPRLWDFFPPAVKAWSDEVRRTRIDTLDEEGMRTDPEYTLAAWKFQRYMNAIIADATEFAQFSIAIRDGSTEDTNAMVAAWRERIAAAKSTRVAVAHRTYNRYGALLEGVYFSRQACWLPVLSAWCEVGRAETLNGAYAGLLVNPQPEATKLALRYSDDLLNYWMHWPRAGAMERLARIEAAEGDSETGRRAAEWRARLRESGPHF